MYVHITPVKPEPAMTLIHAETALLPGGWARGVRLRVEGGRIAAVETGVPGGRGLLLPAPVNLHSHTFQRAMAGLTEGRGQGGQDSFWTWRQLMYRFLETLSPEDVQAIAALAMVEMAEAGYAAVAEFHYLHHAPGGAPYDDPAEMAGRIVAAAEETGLGLTLLPVLYSRGGCDGRALAGGQLRFGCEEGRFATLWQAAGRHLARLGADAVLGVAPHSLRAVTPAGLALAAGLAPGAPVHLHLAEQVAEVAEVQAATGARPVEWLLSQAEVGPRWCAVHATQMTPAETAALARTGAVAGLCPVTEANLGDGIFAGTAWAAAGGAFGLGTDSNLRIALAEEMRMLEYGQRLRDRARAVLAGPARSTARVLWEGAAAGGAQASGRAAGAIAPGLWADLARYDDQAVDLAGLAGDRILDALVFAAGPGPEAVWSAGRQIVAEGRHVARAQVEARYRAAVARLRAAA
jgi:formimidoylglutamate deiminase